jgi:hypothetical protein
MMKTKKQILFRKEIFVMSIENHLKEYTSSDYYNPRQNYL